MSAKPGRNDPCPCGSGKKYKQCHLVADEEAARPPEEAQWFDRAITWLHDRFGGALGDALDELHGDALREVGPDEYEDIVETFDDVTLGTISLVEDEYLLLERTYARRGETRRGIDWVLAAPDLRWSDDARRYLTQLAATPLRLYRIENIASGNSITLRDTLVPTASAIVVPDVPVSDGGRAGDLVGARLFEWRAAPRLGPGIMYFPREIATDTIEVTRDMTQDEVDHGEAQEDEARATAMRDLWLQSVFGVGDPDIEPDEDR